MIRNVESNLMFIRTRKNAEIWKQESRTQIPKIKQFEH